MTRKDYQRIAEIIAAIERYDPDAGYHSADVAYVFAEELAKDSPRFDKARFLSAATKER